MLENPFFWIIVVVAVYGSWHAGKSKGRKIQMIDEQIRNAQEKSDKFLIESYSGYRADVRWSGERDDGQEFRWEAAIVKAIEIVLKRRGYRWRLPRSETQCRWMKEDDRT